MKISILVEGRTEMAFRPHLRSFLEARLSGQMPRLDMFPYDGRIPKEDKLRRVVQGLLANGAPASDAVIALTDIYTGTDDFLNAADAKTKMSRWVGPNDRFFPHVAQHDFEAWLLPYWTDIQRISGHNRAAPAGSPESIDHQHPPSYYVKEIFRTGSCRDHYSKPRDANRILQGNNLAVAASVCPELTAFLNRIISLCGGAPI